MTGSTTERAVVRHAPFAIPLWTGAVLRGDLWSPSSPRDDAALVICHGFKGFKDWGFFPYLGEELAHRTGRVTVCFNFTGSGVGEDPTSFTELERFGHNTMSRELEDLEIVLDGLSIGRLGSLATAPVSRFGLLGHSRGGATAILKASRRTSVRALVTWAAISTLERYVALYSARWEAGEPVFIENLRTGQQMPLYRNMLDDLRAHPDRLDVLGSAAALDIPYLVVHGSEDEAVPPDDALRLAEAADEVAKVEMIDGTGHTMGAGHPFEGTNPSLEAAIAASSDWFRSSLEL